MSFLLDDAAFGGQVMVGAGQPVALGIGPNKIRGSAFIEGPLQIGPGGAYGSIEGTVMIGPLKNSDAKTPDTTLMIKGDQQIKQGDLKKSNLKDCTGQGCNFTSSTINVQSWKGFDIQHPSKENHRLRYVCLEGPEGGVYIRGRVINKTEIELPLYWKDLVDIQSITVSLSPIGAHQDVIIKRWDEKKIYLQSKGGMPIDCFYHIFAERKDGEKLIVEYEGTTPADYPGDSSQYSIAGYDYGARGVDRAD
jgi:hypothetical protein